ncbi:uncharacterized protein MYCFIDRAFT_85581 [Pseudocercospora fijiensis CIRAD86]|uniref:BTB domain-containing protein n=1 Tax=Pseudocercospora fijiensis (strain CIRAD86) TaxID=383855 RepID=M3A1Y1_PSEFD|nr:uncharacterized protein MYCFIDRAFT_85581 [Pseudocercospora fijiensis CIRAD86]EME85174.1 hypothetical protein MYCFIDRAFT_85581 [Pseudocercospora fijiensis CIRAD86]
MAPPMERFLEDFATELVTVKVGPEGTSKEYKVPRGILRGASPWFEAALKEDFGIFLYFLFYGSIAYEEANEGINIEIRLQSFVQCSSVWTFADKYLLPDLKNCAMLRACLMLYDARCAFDESAPDKLSAVALASAWQALPEESTLRNMIADYVVDTLENKEPLDIEYCAANCHGLVRAMHASEAQFHKSAKGDFPRYRKPVKSSLLEKIDADDGLWCYHPRWEVLETACAECGYEMESRYLEHRCMECKKTNCKDHDTTTPLALCYWCSDDYL